MTAALLRLRDAAAAYGVSYWYLHAAVKSERLPAIRPSREWLVEPDAVMAFLVAESAAKAEADS